MTARHRTRTTAMRTNRFAIAVVQAEAPMRSALLALALIPAAFTQTADRKPVFEVATVKPADPAATGSYFNFNQGRLDARNWTFKSYVLLAYSLRPYQLTGITENERESPSALAVG